MRKNKLYLAAVLLTLMAMLLLGFWFCQTFRHQKSALQAYAPSAEETPTETAASIPEPETTEPEPAEPAETEPAAEITPAAEASAVEAAAEPEASDEPEEPYVSPIDFEALKQENEDIVAWLDIPGTEISYPVFQSSADDEYYLTHNELKEYSTSGALFTQKTYNSADFSDPVTIIYGHHMSSGAFFGNLQAVYSNPETFASCNTFTVYTPYEEITCRVFAAVPYSTEHILAAYQFEYPGIYRAFVNRILDIRSLTAVFDTEHAPESDQRMIILQTCLASDHSQRYLVLAAEVEP